MGDVMFLRSVREYIDEHALLPVGARILVGVSGGVDSVVLLHVLQQAGFALEVAHVNYCLRGDASDRDAAFVQVLCQQMGVEMHVDVVDAAEYSRKHGISVQVAARRLRYHFFAAVAQAGNLSHVAVAHHVDDQAETVLLNLLRGTGPQGLAGMAARRPLFPNSSISLVRPLLGMCRADIEAFARERGLRWREDASNHDLKYRRSILRTEVLPLLKKNWGEAATANIARSAVHMRGYVEDIFLSTLEVHFTRIASPATRELNIERLRGLASVWQRRVVLEALHRWMPGGSPTASVAREVLALLDGQVGRRVPYAEGDVWRARNSLVFVLRKDVEDELIPVWPGEPVVVGGGRLYVDVSEDRAALDGGTLCYAVADAGRLDFPLYVRRWCPGDRFVPLGMAGTKKSQ